MWYGQAQKRQGKQYDKAMVTDYRESSRVMGHMPHDARGKMRKLALPYHRLFRVVEV